MIEKSTFSLTISNNEPENPIRPRLNAHFWRYLFCLARGIALFALYLSYPAAAQIIPDATLPVNSKVTLEDKTSIITGGTRSGSNLFHSFSEFSIPNKSEAFFNNSLNIQNIITRVTGGKVSNIDGWIKANGTANLFFLNPSGIIFGPNASLNIGGSFVGTTASRLIFADGTHFSATNPPSQGLLTVSMPVGLGFGSHSGAIQVQGKGHSLTGLNTAFSPIIRDSQITGLSVQPGKTLALVGSNVILQGGILTAEEGRIEIGSVGSGWVSLSPTPQGWALGYEGVSKFKDIQLSQQALVDASGAGGGSIQIQGSRMTLTDGSVILIQNQGSQSSGSLKVSATESLELSGNSSSGSIPSSLRTETVGSGNGGDIIISTRRLVLREGARIGSRTYSVARGGNLAVKAFDSLELLGFSPFNLFLTSSISASTLASGNAGNITVFTGRLTAKDGGFVSSTTLGTGAGGNVDVKATNLIELIGTNPIVAPSALSATAFNVGNAGSLTINTPKLRVTDGGAVNSSAIGSGSAGSVTIKASDSVEISGSSGIGSAVVIADALDRQFFGAPAVPSGVSGDVTIQTGRLSVTGDSQISVRNNGSGNAGTLRINADSIFLDNLGSITAASASGEGGNIFLKAQDLQLRHNSSITAAARGTGNGGNILIDTDTLVVLEDSKITANAFQGHGGNIQIFAQGLFIAPDSAITASSQLGIDGTVEVTTPDTNLQSALEPLSARVITVEEAIAGSCLVRRNEQQGSFVYTGTGGLPMTPESILDDKELLSIDPLSQNASITSPSPPPSHIQREWIVSVRPWQEGDPIIRAQQMIKMDNGVILVAVPPQEIIPSAEYLVCQD